MVRDPKFGGDNLTDHKGSVDLRPMKIVDGQHRVRGGMRSERGNNLRLPVILFLLS